MRKRAQRKDILAVEPKHIMPTVEIEKKPSYFKKNWWVAVTLIAIFLLVLFFNSYFNAASGVAINPKGTSLDKFYLSGPDPYYNMRLVNGTLETGKYPYYSTKDPLLNYPLSSTGGRPPFLNMMAISFSRILAPFMNEVDAVGYSMQFVPALFGALLIFPVYFIGEALFGKKAGLVAAFLVALMPVHIGSGHGSAYSLFDHDSLNLLLFFLAFLFIIKGIKDKDSVRSVLYALLAGTAVAALTMVWVEAQYLYVIIAIYAIVQILIDIFMNKMEIKVPIVSLVALSSGYLISLPVTAAKVGGFVPNLSLFLCLGIAAVSLAYFISNRKKIPWTISLPTIFGVGIVALVFLYFINVISSVIPFFSSLSRLSTILYGSGIYGNKVSLTIAEASTYNISHTVMSFGPALYWLGWAGFLFLIYHYYKNKQRRDYLFIIVLFLIDIWLTGTAGRFINDMVPVIALLGGWVVWMVVDKIDYKQMVRNIRSAGGGFHGLRRGVKILHIFGVLFIAFLVILPNVYIAFDAAIPAAVITKGNKTVNIKEVYFGKDFSGAFGSSFYKENYWVDAFSWLSTQDANIKDPAKRPAFISWWDYGFYEVALGAHPTVADNFQDGIPPAANFHTAKSEKEGVAVWIIRLLEGNRKDNNEMAFSDSVITALQKHLGNNNTTKITSWMLNPALSPSQNAPIGAEYDVNLSKTLLVGVQYPQNAYYHDIVQLLNDTLTDEQITWLYHDIQQATGYSIRYYGVEGYDEQIFNIFAFLGDKSNILTALRTAGKQFQNPEDDFIQVIYTGYTVNTDRTKGPDGQWTAKELNEMPKEQRDYIAVTGTTTINKEDYFNTMFYKAYIGVPLESLQQDQLGNYQTPQGQRPCWGLKHFALEYVSPYPYYSQQRPTAVIIAKYYEGAYLNGSISCNNTPMYTQVAIYDTYGMLHDNTITPDGNFSVIAPAGNITLQFSIGEILLKYIIFNQTNNTLYGPITDAEAMRLNGSKYLRNLNLSVNLSTLEGFVYQDINNNGSYEPTIDTPLQNIAVELNDYYFGRPVQPTTTNADGHYIFKDIYPSKYNISAVNESGYTLLNMKGINVEPDNNTYNISQPKPSAINGVVYFDTNKDSKYTTGEEMSDVNVRLTYTKLDGSKMPVTIATTGAAGSYAFPLLMPGEYMVNATNLNITTGHLDYLTTQTITLTANKTSWVNISLTYAPVIVSGYTAYNTIKIANIPVTFAPDKSVKNNTATQISVTSDAQGLYVAKLKPGTYNVTVKKTEAATMVYTFTDKMVVSIGEGTASYNIAVTKLSVTVSGITKYNDVGKANMTILFSENLRIANNTAIAKSAITDRNGTYTIELTPGSYNASVEELVNESGQNITYTGTGQITLSLGDVPKTFDILLKPSP